jgi:hypothetical protein
MDKWEYGWASAHLGADKVTFVAGALPRIESDDLLNYLGRAGEEGWELFHFSPAGAGVTRLYFKRRTVEEPQAEAPDF